MSKVDRVQAAITPELVEAIREYAGHIYDDTDLVEAVFKYDRRGRRLRGFCARWANGWKMTVNLHLRGGYSISHALRLDTRRPT